MEWTRRRWPLRRNLSREGSTRLIAELDSMLPAGQELDADQLAAIVYLCAWVHAEWVRIHPFANGNGRTARLWANCIAMRYGLSPFIRLRPGPTQATQRWHIDDFLNISSFKRPCLNL